MPPTAVLIGLSVVPISRGFFRLEEDATNESLANPDAIPAHGSQARTDGLDETESLRPKQDAEAAGDRESHVSGDEPAPSLVHGRQANACFQREGDGRGFAGIEMCYEHGRNRRRQRANIKPRRQARGLAGPAPTRWRLKRNVTRSRPHTAAARPDDKRPSSYSFDANRNFAS